MSQACRDRASSAGFTFDDACLMRLNDVLKMYEGTHNYHNFTSKMSSDDPSAKRYILSFQSPGKFVITVSLT